MKSLRSVMDRPKRPPGEQGRVPSSALCPWRREVGWWRLAVSAATFLPLGLVCRALPSGLGPVVWVCLRPWPRAGGLDSLPRRTV